MGYNDAGPFRSQPYPESPGGPGLGVPVAPGDAARQSEYLNFASDSRIAELDGEENFGDYLRRVGVSESLQVTFKGFLEMTMGHVEFSGQAYMRTCVHT